MSKSGPVPEISPARELEPAEIVAGMDGVLRPHETQPDRAEAFLPSPCVQNHAANLAFLPDGSLACVWFGGSMEGRGDISIWMATLHPEADRWSPATRLTDDPDHSEQNPILCNAPDGRLWLFHTAQPGGRQDLYRIRVRTSEDGGASFGPAQRLGDFEGIFVGQPPCIGPGGEWLLPAFRCASEAGRTWTGAEDTALVLISDDAGATWREQPVPEGLGAVHLNMVPTATGPMPAFFHDRFASAVRRSLSHDGGLTWSKPLPTPLPSNNSSIQATRLADGRIAMVLNPVNADMSSERRASLYDEIAGDDEAGAPSWGCGVPTAPQGAKLTSGRLAIGSGLVAELARCPGIGQRSASRRRSIASR